MYNAKIAAVEKIVPARLEFKISLLILVANKLFNPYIVVLS